MNRADQLRDAWQRVQDDVARCCRVHGRDANEVTVIAVTKGHPASDIDLLARCGVTDIGESRDDEARNKQQELVGSKLRWHCIGQVQTNKAAKIADWADVVHAVDRSRVAAALARAVPPGHSLDVLLQVNTDAAGSGRGGVSPEGLPQLVEQVGMLPQLRIAGLMTVAPVDADPRPGFAEVATLWRELRRTYPNADMYSAGMSGDYEQAIAAGATHLRIGTAILGSR